MRLATLHNLHFVLRLMDEARESILQGRFVAFKEQFLSEYRSIPDAVRAAQRERYRRGKGRTGYSSSATDD